jgi:hypothetical protein
MVNYHCPTCTKLFTDKTKYNVHINKKKPCKSSHDTTSMNSLQIMNTENLQKSPVAHQNIANLVENKQETERIFSNECSLCKKGYEGMYIDHLMEEHEIQKEERIFRFTSKTSGVNLYKEKEECGDIVMIVFGNGKGQVYQTKNLHNFQRHKKEKYRDMKELIYYACMDVQEFKKEWNKMLKENRIREDEYIRLEKGWMESKIEQIIEKVHLKIGIQKSIVKTESVYKVDYYMQCPFCEINTEKKTEMELHLLEKHKHIKYYKNVFMQEEHKDKIMNMIEQKPLLLENGNGNEFRCEFCQNDFSNKFNLRRHLKENCKNFHEQIKETEEESILRKEDILNILQYNEKLRNENKMLKETLYTNQEMIKDNNELLKNSVNYVQTTNIIQNNNILFHINDFGKEDISHIGTEFVEDVIRQMNTNSLLKFIEEVHYGNPRNCNVIIPTNMQSQNDEESVLLLKRGERWIFNKRKDVIDDMLYTNIDRIAGAYEGMNTKFTHMEKQGFEKYVTDIEDKTPVGLEMRNGVIQQTEEMILRKQPKNTAFLENLHIQQNTFIEGGWKETIDYDIPSRIMDIENEDMFIKK